MSVNFVPFFRRISRYDRRRNSGFTLIELLIVIAILSILAAILFPVFAQAREKARQTACLTHEKQLGVGILLYAQDNDEIFPWHTELTEKKTTWGDTIVVPLTWI